jgi:hypothetical protein
MARRDKTGQDRKDQAQGQDRRLRDSAGRLARWFRALQGLARRPVGVQRLDGHLRVGFLERRRAPGDALAVRDIVADLSERLMAQDPDIAATVFAPLVQVHDALRLQGWAGVLALPAPTRSRALFQAQMLVHKAPTAPMNQFIKRLTEAQAVAAPNTAASASNIADADAPTSLADSVPEVSEASAAEFDASQQGWLDTVSTMPAEAAEAR